MNVLFDTNIVLDLLIDREPFAKEAAQLFSYVERGQIGGFLCAATITTVYYLATKTIGKLAASKKLESLLKLFDIAPVNRMVLENALQGEFADFEDAVLHEAACHVEAQAIVTRDGKGFHKASLVIYTPRELIKILEEKIRLHKF